MLGEIKRLFVGTESTRAVVECRHCGVSYDEHAENCRECGGDVTSYDV